MRYQENEIVGTRYITPPHFSFVDLDFNATILKLLKRLLEPLALRFGRTEGKIRQN